MENRMNINKEIADYVNTKHWPQLNSILAWKDGELIGEKYYNGFTRLSRNVIRSVGKSITSVGIGIAIDKGFLSLDDKVSKYIKEFDEQRDPRHKIIKIKHLLSMNSGIYWTGGVHYHCPMMVQMWKSGNVLDYIADCPVKNTPGSVYNYSEFDVLLLGAVLDKITGDCFTFINDNLYLPLGIQSGRWFKSKCGVTYSVGDMIEEHENPSCLTAEEMLRIGILFLQDGIYEGKRIISHEYIQNAISPSKANPGYGFLWWLGDGWYGCRGFGGQTITVHPEKRLVTVTQATPTSRPLSYDVIWEIANNMVKE